MHISMRVPFACLVGSLQFRFLFSRSCWDQNHQGVIPYTTRRGSFLLMHYLVPMRTKGLTRKPTFVDNQYAMYLTSFSRGMNSSTLAKVGHQDRSTQSGSSFCLLFILPHFRRTAWWRCLARLCPSLQAAFFDSFRDKVICYLNFGKVFDLPRRFFSYNFLHLCHFFCLLAFSPYITPDFYI